MHAADMQGLPCIFESGVCHALCSRRWCSSSKQNEQGLCFRGGDVEVMVQSKLTKGIF